MGHATRRPNPAGVLDNAIGGAIAAALLPPVMMVARTGVRHTAPDLLLRDLLLVRNLD